MSICSVPGLDPVLVRDDPHLDESDRVVVWRLTVHLPSVVLLRVEDPGPRTHSLGQARVDDPLVALGVLVDEASAEHPGDDLHVPMWVRLRSPFRAARCRRC